MPSHLDKKKQKQSRANANAMPQEQKLNSLAFQFVNNRPEAIAQRKPQEMIHNSPRMKELRAIQEMADNSPRAKQGAQLQAMANRRSASFIQKKENTIKNSKENTNNMPITFLASKPSLQKSDGVVQRKYLLKGDEIDVDDLEQKLPFQALRQSIIVFWKYLNGINFEYQSRLHASFLEDLQKNIISAMATYKETKAYQERQGLAEELLLLQKEKNMHFSWYESNDSNARPGAQVLPPPSTPISAKQEKEKKQLATSTSAVSSDINSRRPQTASLKSTGPGPDPEILDKHKPKETSVVPAGTSLYNMTDSSDAGSTADDWTITDYKDHIRYRWLLMGEPVGIIPVTHTQRQSKDITPKSKNSSEQPNELEMSNYIIKEAQEVQVEKQGIKYKNKTGCFIFFRTQKEGNYHWVSNAYLEQEQKKGYTFQSTNTTYWVDTVIPGQAGGAYMDKSKSPLFPVEPSIDHIKQGGLGDCYLLAALASIMLTNSNFPKSIMKKQGTTVSVKLFDVQADQSSQGFSVSERLTPVKMSVPEKEGKALYAREYLWVQLLEKAYAAGGFTGDLLSKPSSATPKYADIASGNARHAFRVLLGKNAEIIKVEGENDLLFGQIFKALAAKQPVTLGTKEYKELPEFKKGKATKGGGLAGEDILENVVLKHAYSVIKAIPDKFSNFLLLRNPWGGGGGDQTRTGLEKHKENEKGEIKISMGNLKAYFTTITIGPETTSL